MLKCGAIVVMCLMWPACGARGVRKDSREDDGGSSRGVVSTSTAVRVRCEEGATVWMHSQYWADEKGKGYFSRNKTSQGPDMGAQWKIKGYPRHGTKERQYAFWCDHWNGWLSKGWTTPHVGEGQKFTIVPTREKKKFALQSDHWNGYMNPWSATPMIYHGEIWKIWNMGNDQRACDELPSRVTGLWLPHGNLYTHRDTCTKIGVETTVSQSEVETFGKSTTTAVESSVGVEVYGLSASNSVSEEVSQDWAYTYEKAWSTSFYAEETSCVGLDEEKYSYEWIWAFKVIWYGEEHIVQTKDYALTQNKDMPPKCYPGYMTDMFYYQECSPGYYLPGFE